MHVTGTAVPTMTCRVLRHGSVNNATKGCITGSLAHVQQSCGHLPLDKTSISLPRMPDGLSA